VTGRALIVGVLWTAPVAIVSRGASQAIPRTAVLVGAGDIASCSSTGKEATAALLDRIPGLVITIGDNAYPDGSPADFTRCYDPSWGRHKARTRPTPGDHDYDTPGASGYFDYFGAAAGDRGKGYYSYELGEWHIVALNSVIANGPTSEQLRWLRADLAASRKRCILAYFHHPRFFSTTSTAPGGGVNDYERAFWDVLYQAGATIVLNGDDRFVAPGLMEASGEATAASEKVHQTQASNRSRGHNLATSAAGHVTPVVRLDQSTAVVPLDV